MKVKKLIQILSKLPQDATVKVVAIGNMETFADIEEVNRETDYYKETSLGTALPKNCVFIELDPSDD